MGRYRTAQEELAVLHAELCRRDLGEFVRQAWQYVETTPAPVWNWHIDLICRRLMDVTSGRVKRLLINVPPGTMKSLLVSVFWPAWEWASNPTLRYLTGSYSSALTTRDNLRCRAILTSDWYQQYFGVALLEEQNQKTRYATTATGWRIATGVSGPGTGEHPDRVIIDDPHTAAQARSDAERMAALRWFDETVSTRGVVRDVRQVVVMQRLHVEDLSGHLIERGGWEHVMLPMRFEPERACRGDVRTKLGELLWPELFDEPRVRQLEIDLDEYGAAGQLQQRPAPEGGGLFKRDWFQIVDAAPAQATRCRGWDTAGTEGGGDFTAGVRMSFVPETGVFYVEDVVRGQWSAGSVDSVIRQCAELDGRRCWIREEKEPGSSGKAVIVARTKLLAGWDYVGVPTSGDKVTRARPFRAQAEAGNVKLVRGPWNEDYLRELAVFPTGKHDDQVDASSCAFNELTAERPITTRKIVWG